MAVAGTPANPVQPAHGLQRCISLIWGRGRAATATPAAPPVGPPCLTHHEIVELIEPFLAHGYRVNLAGSDRRARSLLFHTVTLSGRNGDGHGDRLELPPLDDTLQLDSPRPGRLRLTRTLRFAGGPAASLRCEGAVPAELMLRAVAPDVRQQFVHGAGYTIAWQHQLASGGSAALTAATAQLKGLTMTMTAPYGGSGRASIEICPDDAAWTFPEDLFAVLGADWSLLQSAGSAWRFRLCLHGGDAKRRFESSTLHLVRTLAETPLRFHQRHLTARWGVSLRRSSLLAAWLLLFAVVACAQPLSQGRASVWPLLAASLPLGLLWWCYRLEEMPRLQWPRRPKAPVWDHWQEPQR